MAGPPSGSGSLGDPPHVHVPGDAGHGEDTQRGAAEGEEEREGVVGAGVHIEDHWPPGRRGGRRHGRGAKGKKGAGQGIAPPHRPKYGLEVHHTCATDLLHTRSLGGPEDAPGDAMDANVAGSTCV